MTDHRAILKRVGLVLIAVCLADIALMIYCIVKGYSYSSSFNIFAVIAGIFLMRGSLGATRLVTWLSAFMLTGLMGAILLFPLLQPLGLLWAQARLAPASLVASVLFTVAVLVLLGWVYRQLRSAPVLAALQASGRTTAAPRWAFGLGIALVALLVVMLNMLLHGASADKAVELARQKSGSGYDYAVQSVQVQWSAGKSHGHAVVAAYNDHEIKYVPVEWSE